MAATCSTFMRYSFIYTLLLCVVVLSLRPVGNTPALKNKKFAVEKSRDISWLSQWLKTKLKCSEDETIVRNKY